MNEESRSRLALARAVAPAYTVDRNVAAALVSGSVARGHADRWSDLELVVFWRVDPTEDARATAAELAGASQRRVFSTIGTSGTWEEDYRVDGMKVDVGHMTVTEADRVVAEVTARADPTLAKQTFVACVGDGVPLYGHEVLADWRTQSAVYPDALVRAMVESHLVFGPRWWLEMLAERGDLLSLYGFLCRVERSVLGVLLGINRVYPTSVDFKWVDRLARALAVAPPYFPDRLGRVFRNEPIDGVQEAIRLIDETVALVETHLPAFDTAPVRARLAAPRFGLADRAHG